MNRLRAGVVGAGVGHFHLKGYQLLPNVDAVALCDTNPARLDEIGDRYNVPRRFTDYRKLFASGQIDAVSIALPNSLHASVSIAALEAGLHVLCEKPLAENVAAGQKIVDAVDKASGKFMICFNRRYRPDVRWIKRAIDAGQLGQIYQVKAGWIREAGIPARTGWFTSKQMAGGGPLIDLGVHMLDLVLWLLDYPAPLTISGDVQANFGPRSKKVWHTPGSKLTDYEVEDVATAFIRLDNGITLNLETSWASHARPGMDDIYLTLLGTEGTIDLYIKNYATENTLTFYTEMNGVPITIRPHLIGEPVDHVYAVAEFVRCIQEDLPPTASAEQGLVIMQIIDAIYRSAEARREIEMPGGNS